MTYMGGWQGFWECYISRNTASLDLKGHSLDEMKGGCKVPRIPTGRKQADRAAQLKPFVIFQEKREMTLRQSFECRGQSQGSKGRGWNSRFRGIKHEAKSHRGHAGDNIYLWKQLNKIHWETISVGASEIMNKCMLKFFL